MVCIVTCITLKSHLDIKLLHLNVRNGICVLEMGFEHKKMLISYVES
jgi:hypothetical protein